MMMNTLRKMVVVEGYEPFLADSAQALDDGRVLFFVNQESEIRRNLTIGLNVLALKKKDGLWHYTPQGLVEVQVVHIYAGMGNVIWSGQGVYALDDAGWWVRIDDLLDHMSTEIMRRACLNSEYSLMAESALYLMTKHEFVGFHAGRFRVIGPSTLHGLLMSAYRIGVPELGIEVAL